MGETRVAWSYPQAPAPERLATVGPVALLEPIGAVSLNQTTPLPSPSGAELSPHRGAQEASRSLAGATGAKGQELGSIVH